MANIYDNIENNFITLSVDSLTNLYSIIISNGSIVNVNNEGIFMFQNPCSYPIDDINVISNYSGGCFVRLLKNQSIIDSNSSSLDFKSGGTSKNNRQEAMNAIAGSSYSGRFLKGNNINVIMNTIQPLDIPEITIDLVPIMPIDKGGTGQVTQQAAINALTEDLSSGKYLRGNGTNAQMSIFLDGDLPHVPDPRIIAYNPVTNSPSLSSMLIGQIYEVTTQGASVYNITGARKDSGSYLCVGDFITLSPYTGDDPYTLISPEITSETILIRNDFNSLLEMVNYINQRRFNVYVTLQFNNDTTEPNSVTIDHLDGENLFLKTSAAITITFADNTKLICKNAINLINMKLVFNVVGNGLELDGNFYFKQKLDITNNNENGNPLYVNGSLLCRQIGLDYLVLNGYFNTDDHIINNGKLRCNELGIYTSSISHGYPILGYNSDIYIDDGGFYSNMALYIGELNKFSCDYEVEVYGANFGVNNSLYINGGIDTYGGILDLGVNNNIKVTGDILCSTATSPVTFYPGINNNFYFLGSTISSNFSYYSNVAYCGNVFSLNSKPSGSLPSGTPSAGTPTQYLWRPL